MNAPRMKPDHFGPRAVESFHAGRWQEDDLRLAMASLPPAKRCPKLPPGVEVQHDNVAKNRQRTPLTTQRLASIMAMLDGRKMSTSDVASALGVSMSASRKLLVMSDAKRVGKKATSRGWIWTA